MCQILYYSTLCQASCTRYHNSAMVVAGSGEIVSSRFTMSHTCSIGESFGTPAGQGSCCIPRRARCVPATYVDVRCPDEKRITFLSKIRQQHGVNNTFNISNTLLYPAETPTVTASCNWWPHSMKPEVGPMRRGRMHSGRWCSQSLRCTRVRPSLSYSPNLLSSLKIKERHSTLQSTLSRHQSTSAWQCRYASGNLARGHVSWVLLQTDGSQWSLMTLQVQHVPGFLSGCFSGGHHCLHNASILTCVCTTRPSTGR